MHGLMRYRAVLSAATLPIAAAFAPLSMASASSGTGTNVRQALAQAISKGAPLYNNGRPDACYEVYRTTSKELIDSNATSDSEFAILMEAMRKAASTEDYNKAAWAMRHAFDAILNGEADAAQGSCAAAGHADRPDSWTVLDIADGPPSAPGWMRMGDGVMGGVSSSSMAYDATDKCITFSGIVSTDRNGGFASMRSQSWQGWDFGGAKGIRLLAKGDGRLYKVSIKVDDSVNTVVYERDFRPTADGYHDYSLDFDTFNPTFRGRLVPDAPSLEGTRVRQVGLMCSKLTDSGGSVTDFAPGPFKLNVRKFTAYK